MEFECNLLGYSESTGVQAMSIMKYPRYKVFAAFFFCPFVLGFMAGIYKFVTLLAHLVNTPGLLGEVKGIELVAMPFLVPFIVQVAFLPPFLVFALIIAWMKVGRTSRNCVLVSLSGALIAMFWVLLFLAVIEGGISDAQFSDHFFEVAMISFASIVICWLAARFFLPAEENIVIESVD